MTRSIYSSEYEKFRTLLIEVREAANLTQLDLAKRLGRPQSFVSKYERGERRLDVIEFLEISKALEVHPFDILKGLEIITGKDEDIPTGTNILKTWEITPEELTLLIIENPSLRGMLIGYIAELKFQEMWLAHSDITSFFKHDDHDRTRRGDRVIIYKGEEFIVEVKSLQTNSIKKIDNIWIGKAQVDGSDKRDVKLADGTVLNTTLLLVNEFDLLAVNIFAFENEWRFVFAKNSDLPRSTYRGYTPVQRQSLLKSLIDVTWPPQSPFSADPYPLLEELYQERAKSERNASSLKPSS